MNRKQKKKKRRERKIRLKKEARTKYIRIARIQEEKRKNEEARIVKEAMELQRLFPTESVTPTKIDVSE